MNDEINEILELSKFHGFDIESHYPDGEVIREKAITIEELEKILFVVLKKGEDNYDEN